MPTIAPPFGVVVVVVVVMVTVRMALVKPNATQKKSPDPCGPGLWMKLLAMTYSHMA